MTKIIVVDEHSRITRKGLAKEKPTHIINSCAGRDHINYTACKERGVKVIEVDYDHADSVADHAIAAFLQLAVINPKQQGKTPNELKGKYAGIIGAGKIGQAIDKRLTVLGVFTQFYDPKLPENYKNELGTLNTHNLDDIMGGCDFLFLACPLNKKTKGLIGGENAPLIYKLKGEPDLTGIKILINVARAEIVNETALIEAIERGLLVGWDFKVNQPSKKQQPLAHALLIASAWGAAVLTEHNAWRTREAKERREQAIQQAKTRIARGELK